MLALGLLDVIGYATFAAGLPLCGAAESSMISAATNQLLTALLSWTVLGRHLSRGQLMSVRATPRASQLNECVKMTLSQPHQG